MPLPLHKKNLFYNTLNYNYYSILHNNIIYIYTKIEYYKYTLYYHNFYPSQRGSQGFTDIFLLSPDSVIPPADSHALNFNL